MIRFATLTILCAMIATASGLRAQQDSSLTVEIIQHDAGLYKFKAELSAAKTDSALLDADNYVLTDSKALTEIELPAPRLWGSRPGKGVLFEGVGVKHGSEYTFVAFGDSVSLDKANFVLREGQVSFEQFEKGRALGWQRSVSSKVVQNDSDDDGFADLGFNLAIHNELPGKFNFRFEGSVTTDKEDPTNHWMVQLDRRSDIWLPSFSFGLRPINFCLTELADQPLDFHDLYAHAFTTLYLRPFRGIQPIFVSAGAGESVQKEKNGEWYNEPRAFLRVQWMMAGLVGKGSRLFFEWHHWDVIDFVGHPNLYPGIEKKRSLVEIEFVLPFIEDKNLRLKYSDGDVAPTYSDITSVEVGFEILFGDDTVYQDK